MASRSQHLLRHDHGRTFAFHGSTTRNEEFFCATKTSPSKFFEGVRPTSVDYRTSGCITGTKLRGTRGENCTGTCWAFATVASLEYYYCRKHGELISFSEKYLVNCADNRTCVSVQVDKVIFAKFREFLKLYHNKIRDSNRIFVLLPGFRPCHQ